MGSQAPKFEVDQPTGCAYTSHHGVFYFKHSTTKPHLRYRGTGQESGFRDSAKPVTIDWVPERGSAGVREIYFKHPGVAVVTWDSATKAVHLEWQGWADSSEIVALNEAGLRALIEHHGSRLLSDSRAMKVIKQADQDWINQDLFPRAFAAGLKRVAVVVPTRDLAMINLDSIAGRIPDTLAVEYFATVDEAREWLKRPA